MSPGGQELPPHLQATKLRCQRKIVAGVTGKTSGHRQLFTSRDSPASQSSRHAPKPGRSGRCPNCALVRFVMRMSLQSQG